MKPFGRWLRREPITPAPLAPGPLNRLMADMEALSDDHRARCCLNDLRSGGAKAAEVWVAWAAVPVAESFGAWLKVPFFGALGRYAFDAMGVDMAKIPPRAIRYRHRQDEIARRREEVERRLHEATCRQREAQALAEFDALRHWGS